MTTIVYSRSEGVVASDSLESADQKRQCQKLYRVNGNIIATAGNSYSGLAFVRWFDQWVSEPDWDDKPDFTGLDSDEDFEVLVVRQDGSCYTVNRLFVPYEQAALRYYTLGSGGPVAAGALEAGATAEAAVEAAIIIDPHTGGKVQKMYVTNGDDK